VFGPEREEKTGYTRKNFIMMSFTIFYFSLNIIRVIRSRRKGLVRHIAHTMTRNAYRFSLDNLKEGYNLGGLKVYGKIILKWVKCSEIM
jgi:hypothetical protein